MSQQLRLRAEGLTAHRARQMMLQPRLCERLSLLLTPAAGEATPAQIFLLVIGKTGKMVEGFLALVTLVDGASAMATLVQQQLCVAPENRLTLEARVGSERVGLREVGLWHRNIFLKARWRLRGDVFSRR